MSNRSKKTTDGSSRKAAIEAEIKARNEALEAAKKKAEDEAREREYAARNEAAAAKRAELALPYWQQMGRVFKGYGNAVYGTVEGGWFMATHIPETINGVGHAIFHPIETTDAIIADYEQKLETLEGQGEIVGDVLISVTTSGFGATSTAAKVSRYTRIARCKMGKPLGWADGCFVAGTLVHLGGAAFAVPSSPATPLASLEESVEEPGWLLAGVGIAASAAILLQSSTGKAKSRGRRLKALKGLMPRRLAARQDIEAEALEEVLNETVVVNVDTVSDPPTQKIDPEPAKPPACATVPESAKPPCRRTIQ